MSTTTATTAPTQVSLSTKFISIMLMFLGSLTFIIYALIFRYNKSLFVAIICFYLIAYSLFIIYYSKKQEQCAKSALEYNALTYITIYTFFFALFMFVFSLIMWIITRKSSTI